MTSSRKKKKKIQNSEIHVLMKMGGNRHIQPGAVHAEGK